VEFAFLLIVAVSAAAGYALRPFFRQSVLLVLVILGLSAFALGLGVIAIAVFGLWPLSPVTAGIVSVLLLTLASVIVPLAVGALLRA
jgi:hypothetical protein